VSKGDPLISKPFSSINSARIEILQALPDGPEIFSGESPVSEAVGVELSGIIEEREGVHYINENALKSGKGPAPRLNQDFKDLVDSILK